MGEAEVSGGDGGGGPELEVQETEEIEVKQGKSGETDGSEPTPLTALRWERFLPKMVLRVLLVEADDSTRQIIAALLRKCSYRVDAVSDGLKAWEVLKERPKNVDLILTEVELPSISGYALLTLIMEHKICKNIPVIMMSSHDSISMVYKCMLRGAADFLVKPVRKNELRNLWQHVWRRQGGNTTDNNLNAPRNEDSIEKGSDDQNSSVKLEMDVGGEENTEERIRSNSLPTHNKVGDGTVNDDPAYLKSSNQAIDLIGAFENYPKCDYTISCSKDKIKESSPPLDLSLTRNPSGSLNQFSDQKNNRLNHSDASAFTRYIKKPRNNEIGLPIPVKGVGFNGLGNAHSSIMSPIQSPPGSAASQDSHFQTHLFHVKLNHQAISYEQSCGLVDQNTDNNTTLSEKKKHISSFTDQSANTRTSTPLVKSTEERGKEKSPLGYQQSQREAALTKFRLKRKDRCFEKKVRYESRKKLAEKRPRVKGQFIRQHPS